jgi:uncharacterized membrane protein
LVRGTPVGQVLNANWEGPMPPPAALRGFGEIDPSFPERMMRMAEQAAEHQRSMEKEAMKQQGADLDGARSSKRRGQWFAAGLAVFFGLVGAWVCYLGHPGSGATIIGSTVVSLAAVYLVGRAAGSSQNHS